MTSQLHPGPAGTVPEGSGTTGGTGRGPIAPRFAIPVIDGFVRAQVTRVVGIDSVTETVRRLRVDRPPGYDFRPGQHALLRLGTDRGPDLRPLSLAGPPDGPFLEFATRAGTSAFKQSFVALEPGDPVKVSRPLGGFAYDSARPAVFVTGGIGITPVRSMLLAQDPAGVPNPVRLLFSNRSDADVPFADELSALARWHPHLSIAWIRTGSRPGTDPVDRLSADLLRRQADELPDAVFYVTGPAAMVSDVRALLRSIGVPRRRIRSVAQGYR